MQQMPDHHPGQVPCHACFTEVCEGLSCCVLPCDGGDTLPLVLDGAFHFALVHYGTVSVTHHGRLESFAPGSLVVTTPGLPAVIKSVSPDADVRILRLVPRYFDSLGDGQVAYSRIVRFVDAGHLPCVPVPSEALASLLPVYGLIGSGLPSCRLNREGVFRHLCGCLVLMAAGLMSAASRRLPQHASHADELFRCFKRMAVGDFRQHHDIAYYAAGLSISPAYLSRIVRRVTGRTVHAILSELIYAEAVRLLDTSDTDIQQIAVMLGFSDQSAFGKFFVRHSGLSPLKFRRRKHCG